MNRLPILLKDLPSGEAGKILVVDHCDGFPIWATSTEEQFKQEQESVTLENGFVFFEDNL